MTRMHAYDADYGPYTGHPGDPRTPDDEREFGDDDDEPEFECERCRGDGMDPECDYLLPCPLCQGEQRP